MKWDNFKTYNEAPTRAFEALCVQIFQCWINREYSDQLEYFSVVNGESGDGGVEAYARFKNDKIFGLQAKWFPRTIQDNQISKIKKSILTAKKVRPKLKKYIVCIPRDLGSKKIGRGKKPIKNYEEKRWNHLIEEIKRKYPDLEINLWNDTRISDELLVPSTDGIRRFWFEKEEFSFDLLKNRFEMAKAGWLKQKYISELHVTGKIHNEIIELLGKKEIRVKIVQELNHDLKLIHNLEREIDRFLLLVKPSELVKKITPLKYYLKIQKKVFLNLLDIAINGGNNPISKSIIACNINEVFHSLKMSYPDKRYSIVYENIIKQIEPLLDNYLTHQKKKYIQKLNPQNKLFIGEPGVGKTHGLANAVQLRLEDELPAVIIRADIEEVRNGWRAIMQNTLGISGNWSEDEIWSALEALGTRSDVKRALSEDKSTEIRNEISKVLICVDGIDESSYWDEWILRIQETSVICERHPNIKFCFSSRPYVFNNVEAEIPLSQIPLPRGDVEVSELFSTYMKAYDIDVQEVLYLKWTIRDPISLRLFCEEYKHRKFGTFEKIETSIQKLLNAKINRLEIEARKSLVLKLSETEQVIRRALINLAKHFLENSENEISSSDARELIKDAQSNRELLTIGTSGEILDFLVNYGFIISETVQSKNLIEPREYFYRFAYQSILDYLIAFYGLENFSINQKLPDVFKKHNGALLMGAVILLSDYNWLIGDKGLGVDDFTPEKIVFTRCFALSHVSMEQTEQFRDWVGNLAFESPLKFRMLLHRLVIPVARIPNHPLGPELIHNILMKFETVAPRDLLWSFPDNLPENFKNKWEILNENPIKQQKLNCEDKFNGLPLLFAWTLTTVDNKLRVHCRKELTSWAKENPGEFLKLLKMTFKTNDPQMKEDLICIGFGVACLVKNKTNELKELAQWALDTIFQKEQIQNINDIVLRHAGRGIVERAFYFGLVNEKDIKLARPPYKTVSFLAYLHKDAAKSIDDSYYPIHGDLAWYTIKKGYEKFFEFYHEPENKICPNARVSVFDYLSDQFILDALSGKYGIITKKLQEELEIENYPREEARLQRAQIDKMIKDIKIKVQEESQKKSLNEKVETDWNNKNFISKIGNKFKSKEADEYTPEAKDLLRKHAIQIGLEELKPHQFALAYSMHFLEKLGWNENEFHGKPNGGKPGEILGADIMVLREYRQASHGQRSPISTFAEKYVWCAIYDMIGYFSDRLRYSFDYDEWIKIENYNLILDIPNAAQEFLQTDPDFLKKNSGWLLPTELAVPLVIEENPTKERITNWINDRFHPEFDKWIDVPSENLKNILENETSSFLTIYNRTMITEENGLADTLFWINSFYAKNEDFRLLKRDFELDVSTIDSFFSMPDEAGATVICDCYISPFEVIYSPSIKEYGNQINYTIMNSEIIKYSFQPARTKIIYDSEEYGEIYYNLPSLELRKLLDIVDGNGMNFFNSKGELVGFSTLNDENYSDNQRLLMTRKDKLLSKLKQEDLNLFWIIRLYKEPSNRAKEQFKPFGPFQNRIWFVWEENGKYHHKLIYETQIS